MKDIYSAWIAQRKMQRPSLVVVASFSNAWIFPVVKQNSVQTKFPVSLMKRPLLFETNYNLARQFVWYYISISHFPCFIHFIGFLLGWDIADDAQAEIEGFVTCPFCDYGAIMENENDKEFRCQNNECQIVSCRICRAESHIPLSCEGIFISSPPLSVSYMTCSLPLPPHPIRHCFKNIDFRFAKNTKRKTSLLPNTGSRKR